MVEPSDAERAALPDATRDYLHALEARVTALEELAATFRDYARDMQSGALRGRNGQTYEAIGAEDLARIEAVMPEAAQ
jgi:hypothetical protein